MGGESAALDLAVTPPAVILMAGLQGSGKTTTTGKLAKLLLEEYRKKPLLRVLRRLPSGGDRAAGNACRAGRRRFLPSAPGEKPLDIALAALDYARRHYYDVLIVDTAGRLAIDEPMMHEIAELHAALKPVETLFVVDSMQGQDAVNVAKAFNEALPLTGVVLTKLDGDARGGAALSVRQVTGKPIKFAGVGEKLNGLEAFHPERMASRILGMGDVLSLVEEARKSVDVEEAKKLADKVKRGKGFDLEDFKQQIAPDAQDGRHLRAGRQAAGAARAGGAVLAGGRAPDAPHRGHHQFDDARGARASRADEGLAQAPRRRRCRRAVQEVNRLLNQFEQMQKMMKQMQKGGLQKMMRAMKGMMPGVR